ncbi:MAG: zf-HC2 domain-containing protein [Deltaproteobacteria bacterium]|nr:zf-HC2 domain-containing protein [Deltaproteobacteria bacterium]
MNARWNDIERVIRMGPLPVAADHPTAETLARFVDAPASLPGAELASIEHHLESCPACRTDLAALRRFDFSAGARLAEEATRTAAAEAKDHDKENRGRRYPLKSSVIELFAGRGWALPLAAAAALVFAFYFSMTRSGPTGEIARNRGESAKPPIASVGDQAPVIPGRLPRLSPRSIPQTGRGGRRFDRIRRGKATRERPPARRALHAPRFVVRSIARFVERPREERPRDKHR